MSGGLDQEFIREVKARVSVVEVIGRDVNLRQRGREYWGCCPFHHEKTASFKVDPARRKYHCFGCGAHGGAIDYLMNKDGLDFPTAVRELAVLVGLSPDRDGAQRAARPAAPPPDPEAEARDREQKIAWARGLWASCRPIAGTLAETYLRARGIAIPLPPSLKFHPALKHSDTGLLIPAMVAAVQDVNGRITGVHRTYLTADGQAKISDTSAKKMGGVCQRGAVRFAGAAPVMGIAEGIETALSVMQGNPGLAVWAALSLGNIAGAGRGEGEPHPKPKTAGQRLPSVVPDPERPGVVLPDVARRVIICADNDNADPDAAEAILQRASARFAMEGRSVHIARPPLGMDFNDLLRAGAA